MATIGVVVPAFNEEKVITASLESVRQCVQPQDIYVVSDGSRDATASLAQKLVPNVLRLRKNRGKAGALAELIKKYSLTKQYDYLFFFDADTRIDKTFVREIKKLIAERPACIVGTVTSQRKKLISAYRVYEYGFSHRFYKNAQNAMGTIIIAPGCTSVYRTDVLEKLDFHGGTLTEDFDLTLQIHRKKLGRVVYCPRAKVVTQDPLTFTDLWRQLTRWNTGFWQNYFLHKLYKPTSRIGLEVLVLIGDFVLWLAILAAALSRPDVFVGLMITSTLLMSLIAVVVIILERQLWALPYIPFFGLFQWTNFASIIFSFFRALRIRRENLSWQKVSRYSA